MKVMFISAVFPPMKTGGADFTMRLCTELATRNHEVFALGPKEATIQADGFTLFSDIERWNWRGGAQRCLELIDSIKPDVVDIIFAGWMYKFHPMVTFLPTFIKRVHPSIRVVIHIESFGGAYRGENGVVTNIIRTAVSLIAGRKKTSYEFGSLLRDSDHIIFLCEKDKTYLANLDQTILRKSSLIPPPPIMPIAPKPSDEERAGQRAELGITKDQCVLAYYGYIHRGKGFEILLDSVARLVRDGNDIRLLVIGGPPMQYVGDLLLFPNLVDDLKSEARKLSINERIIWTDYTPYGSDIKSRQLHLADICVLPFEAGVQLNRSSFWFAAAHALPIVTTKGQDTESVFRHEENVYLCAPADAPALASAIAHLLTDKALCRAIASNIELSAQSYSWEHCIERTLAAYN